MAKPFISGWIVLVVMLFVGISCSTVSLADEADPSKPVNIVAPFPDDEATDFGARRIAKELSMAWKQPVIVDNKRGASGIIGTTFVARAPKYGYTTLFTVTTHAQLPSLNPKLLYDAVNDFVPVAKIANSYTESAVSEKYEAKSVKDLVARMKSSPEPLSYGSNGAGKTSHIYGELFKQKVAAEMTHVPYKAAAQLASDLIAGHIKIAFVDVGTAMPHSKDGKIRPLAIIDVERSELLPGDPTFAESGYQGCEQIAWMGMLMPKNTPKDRVDRMVRGVDQILKMPAVVKHFQEANLNPNGVGTEEFATFVIKDTDA